MHKHASHWYRRLFLILAFAALTCASSAAQQDEDTPQDQTKTASMSLNDRTQALKKEVLNLNRDLFILEEELLFPSNTQVVVFLSLDVGTLFALDSVELKLNDTTVAGYLYTARELDALRRGGIQQLYVGNVRSGKNELVAFFVGKGPHDREYRRGTHIVFDKTSSPKYVELKIADDPKSQQPEFVVKEW